MQHLLSSLCALTLATSVHSASSAADDVSVIQLKQATERYLRHMDTYQARMVVTKVVRLSSGRISEKTYNVECQARNHVMRIGRYARGSVEGDQTWFDIRQTLVFPDGRVAEWRHPGLPGQLTVGVEAADATRVRHAAVDIGDPFAVVRKIGRVMDRHDLRIHQQTENTVIARCSLGPDHEIRKRGLENDYIEIIYSRRFDLLPVSMTRVCPVENSNREFDSGASVTVSYDRAADSTIIPQSAHRDTHIRADVQGTLTVSWKFDSFELQAPAHDSMKLQVPRQALVLDAESLRQYMAGEEAARGLLSEMFGDSIEVLAPRAAKAIVARSFVGRSPDLPHDYALLRTRSDHVPGTSVTHWTLAANGLGLLMLGAFLLRRKSLQDCPNSHM